MVNYTLLSESSQIDKRSLMSIEFKIEDMSKYYSKETADPTIKVCKILKDKINYCLPKSLFYSISNNKINTLNVLPNKILFCYLINRL